ncbi:MAG TPA: GDSL-type esterase/lipase family protein [Thermoleophilaceae bacterium]|nr:GDSL-type esterase/lipase family protein [Thermoleophilaceae bacterium]
MAREPQDSVPEAPRGRRLPARDSVLVVVGALLILILLAGGSVRSAGEEMDPGFQRDVVLAVGKPTGWLADRLPLESAAGDALAWLSPDDDLDGGGGFAEAATPAGGGGRRAAAGGPVSPSEFDPVELGAKAERPRELKTVLVTGDSLAQPRDADLARRLAGDDVRTVRDVHVGTGISKTDLLDWGKLSAKQVAKDEPDAVVVFIGANEGFPMPGARGRTVQCCGPGWAAAYATRVRQMMRTYRQDGSARVYWLTLPFPREKSRQEIARAVNAAIEVAAGPFRAQVRPLDMVPVFTPEGRYRDAVETDGRKRVVRDPDGIHLNGEGASVAADEVEQAIQKDFGSP